MRSNLSRLVLPSVATVVFLVLPIGAAAVEAPLTPSELKEIGKQRALRLMNPEVGAVRTRVSRYLTAVAEASDEGDAEKGLNLLSKLDPKRLNPHERALVYQLSAYVSYASGDLDSTIANFRKVLAEEVMPLKSDVAIRFNIAQILASVHRWEESIEALHEWFRWQLVPSPLAHYLLGVAHFQLEQTDLAIKHTEIAIDLKEEPPEGWLQLLAALYVGEEKYADATPVLEELVIRFPKKKYWVQLSLIYGARDNYTSSLAIQQIAYQQGFFSKDSEIRRLVRSYLYKELPYQAALILAKGLEEEQVEANAENYKMLANSWIAAREFTKSLKPLTLAAELSDNGMLFVRLGQVNLQREDWGKAVHWLEKAVKKGKLENLGSAELLLGISYYNDLQDDKALEAFRRASGHESSKIDADRWIEHMAVEAG